MLATRRGTLALAGVCAVIAATVLLVFLSRYRESVEGAAAPTPVLVATALIQKGTSGDVLAEKRQFETVTRAAEDIKQGGIADPALLAGKVTTADIYPGQQLTASSFVGSTGTVLPKLADSERAIAVPVDEAHGLVGQVQSGDHVDVLASYTTSNSATGQGAGVVKTLLQDKLVLRAGAQPIEGGDEGKAADKSIILRVSDREAVSLAHAADNGKVWVLLRPAAGAKDSAPQTASLDSVLREGKKPPGFKATIKQTDKDTVTITGGSTR
jgi:Flp pilus assembly protein CpaB